MRHKISLPLLFWLLCLPSPALLAQRSWELSGDYGFFFLHSQELAPIGQSYPRALSLNYNRWLLEEKHWENCRCFPRLGLSLGFHYYNNREVLGYGLPLYGFLEPWYHLGGRSYLTVRGGAGLSYNNRPYHPETNPLNFSYSQVINAYVSVGFGYGYRFSKHVRLSLQARYNHVSNGGMRYPNKGLNYPSAALSLDYSPAALSMQSNNPKSFKPHLAQQSLSLQSFAASQAGGTAGEAETATRVTYLVTGLQLGYQAQLSRLSALRVGAEWINNYAHQRKITRAATEQSHHQGALLLGHAFLLGKFVFSQEAGVYLFKDFGATASWYQRYGLMYYPWANFGLGPNIKVHGHVAEFLDFRIAYRFNW